MSEQTHLFVSEVDLVGSILSTKEQRGMVMPQKKFDPEVFEPVVSPPPTLPLRGSIPPGLFPFPSPTKVYSREEVLEATLKSFSGDAMITDVWMNKYLLRNEKDEFVEKEPLEAQARVAKELYRAEAFWPNALSYETILGLFQRGQYVIPQGSPMSAVGNPFMVQSFSNCFVGESPYDSYGGIMRADEEQAQVMKRRGGYGMDVSRLRPKNEHVSNAARTTAGIGVYLERFSNTTREVGQDGRRGALMLSLDCRHPEILTFINIKRDKTKVTGANISVRWHDDFMQAVEEDTEYTLRWPCDVAVKDAQVTKVVRAREIWDSFIDAAHACAEPGALFWDTIIRESISDCYADLGYQTVSTNPCGEIPLSAYDACRLMLLNLMGFVEHPFEETARFDFERYGAHVRMGQRLMDDLIDLEIEAIDRILAKIDSDPEPAHVKRTERELWVRVREANLNGRRTGLGITLLGDCIASLNMRYGSPESIEFTDKVYRHLAVYSELENVNLAKERGHFPIWDSKRERNNPYLNRVHKAICFELAETVGPEAAEEFKADYLKYGRRNISPTTTAPAGSSTMGALAFPGRTPDEEDLYNGTSGIECVAVAIEATRRRKNNGGADGSRVDFTDQNGDKWQEYKVYHSGFKAWMRITGKTDAKESPYYGATSRDVDWEASVDLQAAAQKWVSHSISKTCNLPEDATKETVSRCYLQAWKKGCKGFTIYREGSRTGVIVDVSEATKRDPRAQGVVVENHAPKRPDSLPCDVNFTSVKGTAWIVLVGTLQGAPYEIFAGEADKVLKLPRKHAKGMLVKMPRKTNGVSVYDLVLGEGEDELTVKDICTTFDNPENGAFTRALSLSMRHGVPIQFIVEQLQRDKSSDFQSFSKVCARVLKRYIKDGTKATTEKACTSCGTSPLSYQEGCISCRACGWTKCV